MSIVLVPLPLRELRVASKGSRIEPIRMSALIYGLQLITSQHEEIAWHGDSISSPDHTRLRTCHSSIAASVREGQSR